MIGSKRAYLSRSRRAITCVSNYGIQFELVITKRVKSKAPSTRILIFSNPQLFPSGYGYRPHVSGEFDSESEENKSALQSGKKYIRNESDNV